MTIEPKNAQGVTDSSAFEAGQDPAWFTITRSGDTAVPLTVYYSISGSAKASDYAPALTGQYTFPVNQISYTFPVTPSDEAVPESAETLTLALIGNAAYLPGAPAAATVTIFDSERPPADGIAFSIPSTAQINLDWIDSQDSQVVAYNVYRGTTADFATSFDTLAGLSIGGSEFRDVDLDAATTYYYKVVEVTADGTEITVMSAPAGATTLATDASPPSAPTGLTAFSPNDTEITLRWTDTSANETRFLIQQSLDGISGWTTVATTGPNGQGYTVNNLSPDTNYYFQVAATNTAGPSTTTAPTTASTQAGVADYFVMLVGGHLQRQADLDAGHSVGGIANLLRQNSGGLNLEVHVYAEYVTKREQDDGIEPRMGALGTGQAYTDFQRAMARGIRRWAIVGYSHGGGLTYQFADRVDPQPLLPPDRLGFSAYIDAIQRTNVNDHAPAPFPAELRRPPGSLYHLNIYQRRFFLLAGNDMGGQADDNQRIENTDSGGVIDHVNLANQATAVWQYTANEMIQQLQQLV